jgi:hypothetical protein
MRRKREEFRIPKTGVVILAIDILIILGMLAFVHFYYREAPITSHKYKGIRYRLVARPIEGGINYRIKLLMRNEAKGKKRLTFKPPMCEFIIKKGKQEIWRGSVGEEEEIILEPGQAYELLSIWDQHDKEGRIVDPGEYRIIAKVNHNPPYSLAVKIRVRE